MYWKIATFNANGIRARSSIVMEWLKQNQPDVLCLQEIKCQDAAFPSETFEEIGYTSHVRGQKSFNGVAILTKENPAEVIRRLDSTDPDEESRFIAVKVKGIWVVNTYVPQGRHPDDPAFQKKLRFFGLLRQWFESRFHPDEPIVWAGDMNVAPESIDVFDPKRMEGKIGCHPAEREAFSHTVAWGFQDLFRLHHSGVKQFTFWDYRIPSSFKNNLGWRIDHILATRPLAVASRNCRVDTGPRALQNPSDHTPVWAEFDLTGLPMGFAEHEEKPHA